MEGFTDMTDKNFSASHVKYLKKIKQENAIVKTLQIALLVSVLALWDYGYKGCS